MQLTTKQRILSINNKIAVAVSLGDSAMWESCVQEWKNLMAEFNKNSEVTGNKKAPH